jgi:phage terminase large subunit-like protein
VDRSPEFSASITATIRESSAGSSVDAATLRSVFSETLSRTFAAHSPTCNARQAKVDGDALVFTIPPDDPFAPATWAKANPNFGVSVKRDDLERLARKAQQLPSALPNFLTKRLNVWINADSAWMDMRRWDACADASLKMEDFAGETCVDAIDIASNVDIAARARVFRRAVLETTKSGEQELRTHYYVFGRFYIPEEVVEDSDNSQYAGWVESGHLIATEGNVIDQNEIQDDLRADKDVYQIREIAYDPFQATKFALELQGEGFTMVEMGATVKNFSAPMKSIEALVRSGRLHHTGDPAFAWMISNIVAHVDKKDNVFPNKRTEKQKIDGGVALIMAVGRWEVGEAPQGPSVYETEAGLESI